MHRHVVDTQRSRIDLTPRPALPGVRLIVDEVAGAIDLDDLSSPGLGRGTLTVWLRTLIDDDVRAGGVPPWLRHGDVVAVDGDLDEARCDDAGHVEVRARFRAGGRVIPLTGAGRAHRPCPDDDTRIEAVGITLIDPRSLGFALPPLITFTIHARWRLVLTR